MIGSRFVVVILAATAATATAIAPVVHAESPGSQSDISRVAAANQALTARERAIEKCQQAALSRDRERILCIDETTGGDFGLPMQRSKLTTIRFPHEIRNGAGSTMGLDIRIDGHHVIVRQTAHQVHGNFFIHSTTGYTVAFDPEIVEPAPAGSDEKPPKLFVVVTLAEMERREAEAQRREAEAQRRDDEREAREKETQASYRTAEQALHHIEMKTAPSWRDPSHRLPPVRVERVAWVDNHPHAKFVVENRQSIQARDIVEIRLSDGQQSNVRAEIVVLDTPSDDDNRLPATILPGEKAQGVVRIPDELKGVSKPSP